MKKHKNLIIISVIVVIIIIAAVIYYRKKKKAADTNENPSVNFMSPEENKNLKTDAGGTGNKTEELPTGTIADFNYNKNIGYPQPILLANPGKGIQKGEQLPGKGTTG